jgi:hypothetical protein
MHKQMCFEYVYIYIYVCNYNPPRNIRYGVGRPGVRFFGSFWSFYEGTHGFKLGPQNLVSL